MGEASISFERLADVYDVQRGGVERGKRFADDVAPWLDHRPGPVLEVGVGTGAVAFPLHLRVERPVMGVDLSPSMLARAAARLGPGLVAVGDAQRLPVRDGSIADAIAVWVFQLVGDRAAVMAEVARVLAPGGRFVVVPAQAADRRRNDLEDAIPRWHELLGRRFTAEEDDALVELAEAAGLRSVQRSRTVWQSWEQTPNEEAERVEQRSYGALFSVDDDTWARVVQPVVDRLRSLPHPDRARTRSSRHHILVFER